jgi:hypothetical protein
MTREENAERAKSLLRHSPMTRFDLECRLGISQQRISEALRDVGAHVSALSGRPARAGPHRSTAWTPRRSSANPSVL